MATFVTKGLLNRINKQELSKLSVTNQYQVNISGLDESQKLVKFISDTHGLDTKWIVRNGGLMCSDATLPTSSFATSEVKDNFQGINQQFAHTRLYVDTDFTFYVDDDYKMIKFFEGWMDFISGGAYDGTASTVKSNEDSKTFYRRFHYPNEYKVPTIQVAKFNRGKKSKSLINYKFFNAFPKSMQSMQVSYGGSDLLKVTVSLAYDRYILENGVVEW